MVYFDPLNKACKSVTGAVEKDEKFTLALTLDKPVNANRCFLCFYSDNGKIFKRFMTKIRNGEGKDVFSVDLSFPVSGLFFYYFEIETDYGLHFVVSDESARGHFSRENGRHFQLTVFEADKFEANWFKGGLTYHVFVDRFFKGREHSYPDGAKVNPDWYAQPDHRPVNGIVLNNEFFGGDISGITKKLSYIKSLGVTAIYISPVFEANSNHKYNTGDFLKIDEGFGDEKDFENLICSAKKLGISIIIDGVFSHTGDDSVYFNKYGHYDSVGAFQSENSPYFNWYSFVDYPNVYKSWWGIDTLPEIDKTNESYREFICEQVIPKWLEMGVDGIRLDVADELPDCFLTPLCQSIKNCGDKLIIGEVWENATDKISYGVRRKYFQGGQLDSVMNYPLKNAILSFLSNGDGKHLVDVIRNQINNYPKHAIDKLLNILSSHDTPRAITVLGGKPADTRDVQSVTFLNESEFDQAKQKLKIAALLQYTLYGVPCLFYGDEAGLQGYGDPFCRKCYPWEREDAELVKFYATLGKLRANDIFVSSEVVDVHFEDGIFSFERRMKNKIFKVFVNMSGAKRVVDLEKGFVNALNGEKLTSAVTVDNQDFIAALFDTDFSVC